MEKLFDGVWPCEVTQVGEVYRIIIKLPPHNSGGDQIWLEIKGVGTDHIKTTGVKMSIEPETPV